MIREMTDINNWVKIDTGIYRYDISEKIHCEIIILYKDPTKDILDSISNLYVFGNITSIETGSIDGFERACFEFRKSMRECMYTAARIMAKI